MTRRDRPVGRALVTPLVIAMLALSAVPPQSEAALVICKKGKQVLLRETSCKRKEQAIPASDLGVTGPIGAPGPEGQPGPANVFTTLVRLNATEGPDEATARAAAPLTELFTKGQISITAKCFRNTGTNETSAEIYVASTGNGAVFDGSTDELNGGNAATDFLNVSTLETDRVLDSVSVTGNDAVLDEGEFSIIGADSTHLVGQTTVAAKNGALAGGNGVYGEGNVCLVGAEIAG